MKTIKLWEFVEEGKHDFETAKIIIKEGQFKDIIYSYGKVSFNESEAPVLSFSYKIHSEKIPEDKDSFIKLIGDILSEIIIMIGSYKKIKEEIKKDD